MKKLCFLLVLLLLFGCAEKSAAPAEPNISDHADNNDDGLCDHCKEVMLVTFDVFAINDLHGKLADTPYQPGADGLSTYLKHAQRTGNTILISTGDMWQGTSESGLTKGLITTEWMNHLGFAAMTLGGHEYDWGEDGIRENRKLANFPFLGINVYSRKTNQRADYCESSLVVDIEGAQIGIIGAIGNCYYSIASEHTTEVYFLNGDQLTELVKAESEKLRSQGADFIIYAIHDGFNQTTSGEETLSVGDQDLESYYDSCLSEGYVDLVFEADSHYWYQLVDPHGVYHLQAGGNNQGLSHATVLLNKANGNSTVLTAELIASNEYAHLESDPIIAQLLSKYDEQIAPATKTLGHNGQYRTGRALCQLVADLYCQKGTEKWGKDYDIVLGGGYISCRSPGYMPEGAVSYSQLQSLLPFDNQITLCSIRGRDLSSKFLETDHHAYYIKTTPYGESIRTNIDPNATYFVVTDSYSANYAPNNLTIIDVYDEATYARDLMAQYVANGSME